MCSLEQEGDEGLPGHGGLQDMERNESLHFCKNFSSVGLNFFFSRLKLAGNTLDILFWPTYNHQPKNYEVQYIKTIKVTVN